MTEDYKKSLIDYVSGLLKIEQERPTDFDPEEIAGTGVLDYNSQDWAFVINAFNGKNVAINGILENENYDNYIMYGGYQNGDSGNSNGFLIYINEYGKPTKVRLLSNARGFQCLKFDEINNRVYGVAGNRANYPEANDNDTYFVYYNNLFLTENDETPPDITYSYKIHSDSSTEYFMARDIIKHPERPFYLIYATSFVNINLPTVVELRINVGQENEVKTWNIGSDYFSYAFYGWYSGETPHFKVILWDYANTKQFKLGVNNGDNIDITNLSINTTLNNGQIFFLKNDYVATNENNIYFVFNDNWSENNVTKKQCHLLKYDGTTAIKSIYKTNIYNYETNNYNIPVLNVVKDINTIYCIRVINDEANDASYISVVNISDHSNPQESDFEDLGNGKYIYRVNIYNFRTILKRQYNIVYFNSFNGYLRTNLGSSTGTINGYSNQAGRLKQRIGYTGYPYSYYNVLVPRYVNLYYQNIALFFSRNVYNITRFNNTTTASVEVPAQYLNNYTISRQKLFGNTAVELVRNQQLISKNQYEVLHINFLNTINVIDEDTNTMYEMGAIKTNEGITTGTQTSYNNTKCTKYRVNYEDGTSEIGTITWQNITDLAKQTNFTIYVEKAIKNIDLISNDESTIYLTINGNFEIDNYYTINQKVRIGDKPQQDNLVYNAQNVLYNGEQVKVYTI